MIITPETNGITLSLLLLINSLIRLFPLIPNNNANLNLLLDFIIAYLENTKVIQKL